MLLNGFEANRHELVSRAVYRVFCVPLHAPWLPWILDAKLPQQEALLGFPVPLAWRAFQLLPNRNQGRYFAGYAPVDEFTWLTKQNNEL